MKMTTGNSSCLLTPSLVKPYLEENILTLSPLALHWFSSVSPVLAAFISTRAVK